jgi:hypothetical protein
MFVKSVLAEDTSIKAQDPLVVGSRSYKAPTITLSDKLVGKISAASIVMVDPASYT